MQILSFVPDGFKGRLICVEVFIRKGDPSFKIIGFSDTTTRKTRDRIRSALLQSGFDFPEGQILTGFSPAYTGRLEDSFLLSLAVAVLSASNQILQNQNDQWLILGGLEPSGRLKPATEAYSAVMEAMKEGIRNILVPVENSEEAVSAGAVKVVSLCYLKEINDSLAGHKHTPPSVSMTLKNKPVTNNCPDIRDLRGQAHLKRALVVGAAGGHHMLLFGPSCPERTLCASLLEGLLPDLTPSVSHEVSRFWALAGKLPRRGGLMVRPPFRKLLFSTSRKSLFSGGTQIISGDISLTHGGVLFLDEVQEFKGNIQEGLRKILDFGRVSVDDRVLICLLQLLMTVSSCPCGKLGHPRDTCECSNGEISRYWEKIRTPLIERTDLRIPYEPVNPEVLQAESTESTADLKERITAAAQRQYSRYRARSFTLNRDIPAGQLHEHCFLNPFLKDYLRNIIGQVGLSYAAGQSILKVSRTIADLGDRNDIRQEDLEEAVQYRRYGDIDFFWNQDESLLKRSRTPQ